MERIGQYEIRAKIGSGGMGTVYLAFDPSLKREVAIKVLNQDLTGEAEFIARFHREAMLMAKLRHPNLVHIYAVGEDDVHYFVMEYIKGRTLSSLIRDAGRLSLAQSFRFVGQVLAALNKVHEAGLIHRDIKPANIMIDEDGRAILMDFSLAKPVGEAGLTSPQTLLGTPEYLAPELIEGEEPDARSDIYAIGVLLYHTLTGAPPFRGKSAATILASHMKKRPEPLTKEVEGLPSEVDRVVLRCLEKKREDRYQTVRELATDMLKIVETPDLRLLSFPEDEVMTQKAASPRKRRALWGVFGAAVVAVVLLLGFLKAAWLRDHPKVEVTTVDGRKIYGRLLTISPTGDVQVRTDSGVVTENVFRDKLREIVIQR